MSGILIMGTGGHAKVALDILLERGENVAGFLDDNPDRIGTTVLGYPVLGDLANHAPGTPLILGIGGNLIRKQLFDRFPNALWVTLVHPSASVSRFATLGVGAMICMGACVGPDTVIGRGAVVNTQASVDHDCRIGDFAHVAVGVTIAGGVTIGEGAMLGAGAAVIPNLEIGGWSVVGAGAAVVKSVPERSRVVGVPARPL